ncbi:MAG: tRNA (adenosine(37)-N6)-threonylcarbamoyltransferase complex ATPase subunit type 1 TsaE [Candidatus Omnitrophica bacterium]|nr:tRNA (adenosine(37)-N6)-threonylcarbamoyltransferase complex ATPase subunit type 1 TsaE [Candidatus Omnitrophota bacterium]
MTVTTATAEETIRLGEKIARRLKPGDLVALSGELGAGKTTLVKGIAKGLGVKNYRYVNSPSFVLVKEYKGKVPLFHFDIYRLNNLKDIEDIGYEDYLARDGVVVIEWSGKMGRILPKKRLEVILKIKNADKRAINIKEAGHE